MKRAQRMSGLLRRLRRCAHAEDAARPSDGQLLGAFIERRDEEAFTRLVERHGPMVLGVCRRVLASVHDAEDAFQATFLVLVRKARAIGRRELVGNWLYGVAYRTALEARAKKLRRMARQKPIADVAGPVAESPLVARELQALLDRELSRLPDKYRVPVVLCDLEGRGRRAVAQQLGVPEGTLSSRLATARKLLSARLSRHGLALGVGVLTAALGRQAPAAGIPPALISSTVGAAMALGAGNAAGVSGVVSANVFALIEGVLKAMFLTKLRIAAAWMVLIGALSIGTAGVAYRVVAGEPQSNPTLGQAVVGQNSPQGEKDKDPLTKVLKELHEAQAQLKAAQVANEKLRRELETLQEESRQRIAKLEAESKLLRDQLNDVRERFAQDPTRSSSGATPAKGKVKDLLRERLATLQQIADFTTKEFDAGKGSFVRVYQVQMALHNAELELCETDNQRLEILKRIVAEAHRYEEMMLPQFRGGLKSPTEYLQARVARLEAEIALERAKAKAGPQK
jgi:RNA polymerase sigma factor (sigma-70 family)